MARTKPWEVSDEVWERVRPLIPEAPSHARGGRRRMDDRKAFEAIVYVLRTGIQWNALPRELGASSTVHDGFQEWERVGSFKAIWPGGLREYDDFWLSMSSLGRGTEPLLAQSLASSPRSVGKEGGELSCFPSSGLCSTHLRQGRGFRISFKTPSSRVVAKPTMILAPKLLPNA